MLTFKAFAFVISNKKEIERSNLFNEEPMDIKVSRQKMKNQLILFPFGLIKKYIVKIIMIKVMMNFKYLK